MRRTVSWVESSSRAVERNARSLCAPGHEIPVRAVSHVLPDCTRGAEPGLGAPGQSGPVTWDTLLPNLQRALGGRYVLERRLGHGGMGVVYLAREVSLERRVAIKLLTPDRALQPNAKQRFLQEARTAAQLWHPGIIPIFAVDEVCDFVFFAMAYVEGQTLGQWVRGDGPLSYAAVARMLEEVARALDYAHARGVVHRDVKPDNILIELRTGRALVSDFGIARRNGGGSPRPRQGGGAAGVRGPGPGAGGRGG